MKTKVTFEQRQSLVAGALLAALWLGAPVIAHAADASQIVCSFKDFIRVKNESTSLAEHVSVHQGMTVVNGKTAPETLQLDGKHRATNSRRWTLQVQPGRVRLSTVYVGDDAEVLTLVHDLQGDEVALRGSYKAVLTSAGLPEWTGILLGACDVTSVAAR